MKDNLSLTGADFGSRLTTDKSFYLILTRVNQKQQEQQSHWYRDVFAAHLIQYLHLRL